MALLAGWYFGGPFMKRAVPILMYHQIGDAPDDVWSVSPAEFEQQMRQLKEQGYETVLPSDLVAYARRRKPLPRKPVVITFDDGSLSVKELAVPILRKQGYRAIVYLITAATADTPSARRESEGHPCLTWEEVRAMREEGTIVFGSHSVHHSRELILSRPAAEIEDSMREIREKGGLVPDSFCYPFNEGAGDAAIADLIRRAGYSSAVCCSQKKAGIRRRTDFLHLPRLWVLGGKHVFEASAEPAEGGRSSVVHLGYEGVNVEVSPRFVWPGQTVSEGWLPALELRKGGTTWSPDKTGVPPGQKALSLQLWDKYRFFLLYSYQCR
jgi:peptidoglycan/xylan/chitin deacetylase (PgdA/CDA1 family)